MSSKPLTNLCIISDKKNCPPRYNILDQTADNDDGDFWKDKFFKAKNYRYLCYSTESESNQLNQVITDLALIGTKDPVPDGYTAITTTADSKETALQKQVLCARYTLKNFTNAAIVDICLFKDQSYREKMYTLVGEVNGINLTFKMGQVIMQVARPAPPVPSTNTSQPTPNVNQSQSSTTQSNHLSPSYDSLQRQSSSKPMSGIEGIPFKLNERFAKTVNSSPSDNPSHRMTIRTLAELTRLATYDFSQEKTVVGAAS